jgi:hypothetical protein
VCFSGTSNVKPGSFVPSMMWAMNDYTDTRFGRDYAAMTMLLVC